MTTRSSPNSRFKRAHGALHGAVRGRGRAAVGVLPPCSGWPNSSTARMPSSRSLPICLHDVLDAQLRDAGHRRDRLVRALRRQHEVRHDQLLGASPWSPRRGCAASRVRRKARARRVATPACVTRSILVHCIASRIPSRLGSRASAVTARPARARGGRRRRADRIDRDRHVELDLMHEARSRRTGSRARHARRRAPTTRACAAAGGAGIVR